MTQERAGESKMDQNILTRLVDEKFGLATYGVDESFWAGCMYIAVSIVSVLIALSSSRFGCKVV
jgi:hypothetical protein